MFIKIWFQSVLLWWLKVFELNYCSCFPVQAGWSTHDCLLQVPQLVHLQVALTPPSKLWILLLCVPDKFQFEVLLESFFTFHLIFMWATWLGLKTDLWEWKHIELIGLCLNSPGWDSKLERGDGTMSQNNSQQKVPVDGLCVHRRKTT